MPTVAVQVTSGRLGNVVSGPAIYLVGKTNEKIIQAAAIVTIRGSFRSLRVIIQPHFSRVSLRNPKLYFILQPFDSGSSRLRSPRRFGA